MLGIHLSWTAAVALVSGLAAVRWMAKAAGAEGFQRAVRAMGRLLSPWARVTEPGGAGDIYICIYINFIQDTGRSKKTTTQYIYKNIEKHIQQNNTFKKDANEASAIIFILKTHTSFGFPEAR